MKVPPRCDAYALSEIAKATGLSLAACSRIRAGTCVPHPRHWEALLALDEGDSQRDKQAPKDGLMDDCKSRR